MTKTKVNSIHKEDISDKEVCKQLDKINSMGIEGFMTSKEWKKRRKLQ